MSVGHSKRWKIEYMNLSKTYSYSLTVNDRK